MLASAFSTVGSMLISRLTAWELHQLKSSEVGKHVLKLSLFNLLNTYSIPIAALATVSRTRGSVGEEYESTWCAPCQLQAWWSLALLWRMSALSPELRRTLQRVCSCKEAAFSFCC